MSALITLVALVIHGAAAQAGTRTEVRSLPGFGVPPTKHFSGFVQVDKASSTSLFYYLVTSADDPSTDPLVWWMNGGPGASSLVGLFAENGPLLLNASGALVPNPYAWNAHANVLYVEFGAGIGFSFCANSSDAAAACPQASGECSPCHSSDDTAAAQGAAFLEALLTDPALFPELAGRATYLTGESYAGVYVPTLAAALLDLPSDGAWLNLQGLWVTDPCTDNAAQSGWLDLGVEFAWQKALIDRQTYQALSEPSSGCVAGRTPVGDRVRATATRQCRAAWRLYDIATAGIGDAVHPAAVPGLPMYIDPLSAVGFSGGPDLQGYIGSPAVRAAINALASPNKVYHVEIGNNGYPQYTSNYAACSDAPPATAVSMLHVYRTLLAGRRPLRHIIVSNGDIDPVVDIHGTEAAITKLGLPVASGGERRPWFFRAAATPRATMEAKPVAWGPALHEHDAGPQVGGFCTNYLTNANGTSFTFVAVRDSGHMVPAYVPQRARHILHRLLDEAEPALLSPPLPADWADAPDAAFYARGEPSSAPPGLFAKWVREAMAPPYVA